jgi:hypothetical protein
MISPFRVVSTGFALDLALVTLVGPLAEAVGVSTSQSLLVALVVSFVAAFALLSHNPDLYVDGVWHFGFLVFLLTIGVHALLGTGLTDAAASLLEIVGIWLLVAGAVLLVFRETVREQLVV